MKRAVIYLIVAGLLVGPLQAMADTKAQETTRTDTASTDRVTPALGHLFDQLAVGAGSADLDMDLVSSLIRFSKARHPLPETLKIDQVKKTSNGSVQFTMDTSMDKILRYMFNPKIPRYAILPGLLRWSKWAPGSEILNQPTPLWEAMETLDAPIVLHGRKYEVNTPNPTAGTYYRYDLDRMIILMKHQGQPVLISVSKTVEPSTVGKKGAVVDDTNWDYFYSGEEGVTRGLVGWARTHIYTSASVVLYCQKNASSPRTTVTQFSFLKAGWKGLNMVKSGDISDGCQRFADQMKGFFERADFPDAEVFSRNIEQIQMLPKNEVADKIRQYAIGFERKANQNGKMTTGGFAKIIENGGYAHVLTHEESMAVLLVEYCKLLAGKQPLVRLSLPQPIGRQLSFRH